MKSSWTKSKIIQEAKKYCFMTEFELYCPEAYRIAQKRGYLEQVCSHMELYKPRVIKKGTPLTQEYILQEAKKCKTKWEFKIKYPGAYQKANELKIMNECFPNLKNKKKTQIRWNHDLIAEEAKKYTTLDEFELHARGGFKYAQRHNILDKITAHMSYKRFKPMDKKARIEVAMKEAEKYVSRTEFRDKDPINLKFLERHKREDILFSIFGEKREINKDWTKEAILEEARLYTQKKQFARKSPMAAIKAKKMGIYEEACAHMSKLVNNREQKLERYIVEEMEETLTKSGKKYQIQTQSVLYFPDQKIILDIVLILDNKIYPLEIKHDSSYWTLPHINRQVEKYNILLKPLGYEPVTVVSDTGKYGLAMSDFFIKLVSMTQNFK